MAKKEAIKGKIYKCPNCGSVLHYDPQSKKLKCTHCSSLQELVNVSGAFEIPYTPNSETSYAPWGDAKSLKCRSCGAEFAVNDYETATSCPFCGTTNIMHTDDVPGIKPNAILPFAITEQAAKESFKAWLKKRSMSPNNLKKLAEEKGMKGVYVPIFTFDADTFSTYTIRYGVHRTVTVGTGKERHTVVVTDWYIDSGRYNDEFDDIQIEVSNYLTQKNLSKIKGFDSNNAKLYNPQYVAGFSAERYSTGLDKSWEKAAGIMENLIRQSILGRYSYDELDYLDVKTEYHNKTYKYLLAPVWVLVYNYKSKQYYCIVNGRNGKADGLAPLSPLKVAAVSIASAAVVAGIVYLIYKFVIE
ncbi:MAG: hypothetical protein K5923_03430 [Clostridia bacterium]|nr:hypothetical protein [Clostridia bacterium]